MYLVSVLNKYIYFWTCYYVLDCKRAKTIMILKERTDLKDIKNIYNFVLLDNKKDTFWKHIVHYLLNIFNNGSSFQTESFYHFLLFGYKSQNVNLGHKSPCAVTNCPIWRVPCLSTSGHCKADLAFQSIVKFFLFFCNIPCPFKN